ncbi:MAG: hypothetical protein JST04_08115 [Bdellovibrionales bacterium]|nr:hypothetical protein [Bdellovibrionales bacterium]
MNRFERLANLRNQSLDELIYSMGMSRDEVLAECESSVGPKIPLLQRIADEFELTFDDLLDGRIDEEWARNPELAPMFKAEEGSRLRTSLAVIRWIENHYGRQPTVSLTRALRIPKKALANPDQPVRLKLLGTLLKATRARGLSDSVIFEMGVGATDIPENAEILATLAKSKNPRQMFEHFFAEILSRFESNYEYRIDKCDSHSLTLRIRPLEQRILENGREVATDRSIAIYRWGVAAGLLKTMMPNAAAAIPIQFAGPHTRDELVRLDWDGRARETVNFPMRKTRVGPHEAEPSA